MKPVDAATAVGWLLIVAAYAPLIAAAVVVVLTVRKALT